MEPDPIARLTSAARLSQQRRMRRERRDAQYGMTVRGRHDQGHPGRFGKNFAGLLGEAGQVALPEEARMRESRRQQEMSVDFALHIVSQGGSVVNQRLPSCFSIAIGDPTHHHQREDDQRQDDDKRQYAQTPAQRTGLDHAPVLSAKSLGRVKASSRGNPPRRPPSTVRGRNSSSHKSRLELRLILFASRRDYVPDCRTRPPADVNQDVRQSSPEARGTAPQQSKMLSGKRCRLGAYANYDPPFCRPRPGFACPVRSRSPPYGIPDPIPFRGRTPRDVHAAASRHLCR